MLRPSQSIRARGVTLINNLDEFFPRHLGDLDEFKAGFLPASKSTDPLAEDKDGSHPDGVNVLRVGGQVTFQPNGEI